MKVFELLKVLDKAHIPSIFVPVTESVRSDFDMPDSNTDADYGLNFDDFQDFKLDDISSLLLDTLRAANNDDDQLQIVIPSDLAEHLAKDINYMSRNEPCGARGCVVDLIIEDCEICTRIGKFEVDPLTVTTFEVTIVLQRKTTKWFQKLQMMLKNNTDTRTVIKRTYKLIKRKLYRKDNIVVVQDSW